MHKFECVLENKMHKIACEIEITTDQQMLNRRANLGLVRR